MPQTDSKGLKARLKKGEIDNIYYIFGADVPEVEKLTKLIIRTAIGDNDEFALTRLEGRYLDFSELYDMIQMVPMMADYNCILINDYNCERPCENMAGRKAEDINKKLIETIKEIPPQTVVIFNVTGFEVAVKTDYKTKKNTIKDKNKKLADFAAKHGTTVECTVKTAQDMAKDISSAVSARGGFISINAARELAEMCQCDTLTVKNEIDKLCSYSGSSEITLQLIQDMVHHESGTTAFKLADAVAVSDKKTAFEAVDELMADKENRGSVLGAVTSVFLDMYRVQCARRKGISAETVKQDFAYYSRAFAIEKLYRNGASMSVERLRKCIRILRDTNMKLNSSSGNEKIILEQMITAMLVSDDKRR